MRLVLCSLIFLCLAGCPARKEIPLVPSLPLEIKSLVCVDPLTTHIVIDVSEQKLFLYSADSALIKTYPISTSRFGVGYEMNSKKTPLGRHRIYEKVGAGEPIGRIFNGRKPFWVEHIVKELTEPNTPSYITTRILWLEGLEEKNKNTKARYIYIHGTNREGVIGKPASIGCIYMKNQDVVELFDWVSKGTIVEIIK